MTDSTDGWITINDVFKEENERFRRECEEVKRLGDEIGYGNMMTIASALWAKMLDEEGGQHSSAAFHPTILSNMKTGDLTVKAMKDRAFLLKTFKEWEQENERT